ncbi:MAG TPA: hypothetical protein VHV52_06575, partial [Gaiellaceae bacterium]|nr:hypothetical protein [Gaiellaceae bacterium]
MPEDGERGCRLKRIRCRSDLAIAPHEHTVEDDEADEPYGDPPRRRKTGNRAGDGEACARDHRHRR